LNERGLKKKREPLILNGQKYKLNAGTSPEGVAG
jgi:hypothetical protein